MAVALLDLHEELALRWGFVGDGRVVTKGRVGPVVVDPLDQLGWIFVQEVGEQVLDRCFTRISLSRYVDVAEDFTLEEACKERLTTCMMKS